MPALTRRGKWLLPEDDEDDEDDLGNIGTVGILAQWAARREAAQEWEATQEQEAAQAQTQEPADNQVRILRLFLIVYIHDAFLKFQDENALVRPPTPPHSSPLRQEGRSFSSSTVPQWCNSSPTAQRRRSRSSSFGFTRSPSPNRFRRTPPAQGMSSSTREPLMASVRSNIEIAIASSSRASGHQAPPPPAITSTTQNQGRKSAPTAKRFKRRKKNW